jgi:hypothetical protein
MATRKNPKKQRRGTAFVPSVVFGTAVLGVIPACAMGCSSGSTKGNPMVGVAMVGYCPEAGCPGVAAIGFDAGLDGGSDAETGAVAAVAFLGFDAGLDSGDQG